MRNISFTKMQGLGNDFIVVDGPFELSAGEIKALCDRRFGIGADGLLMVSNIDPIRMDYWNADGSTAEMCGNGLRCVARYAYDKGWSMDRNFGIATPIGVRAVRVLEDGVEAQIGQARLGGEAEIEGESYRLVDVGNPHAVRIVEDVRTVDVSGIGRRAQTDPRFQTGINVEFAAITDEQVAMRVWERGVGETMACGTGMVASALVATEKGLGSPIEVKVPGGVGLVDFREGSAWLKGPAEYSFRGNVGER